MKEENLQDSLDKEEGTISIWKRLVKSALHPNSSFKLLTNYEYTLREDGKTGSKVNKYVRKKIIEIGLSSYIKQCISRGTYLSREGRKMIIKGIQDKGIGNDKVKKSLILLLTDVYANKSKYPYYYNQLKDNFDGQLRDTKKIIQADVNRTHSSLMTEELREILFNILLSFAKRNGEIKYCQGMNSIAWYLLTSKFKEEECFWIMVYLMEVKLPRLYYQNMIPVMIDIKLIRYMIELVYPDLDLHLKANSIDLGQFFVPWFVTLFTNISNKKLVDYIFELILTRDENIHCKLALTIVGLMKDTLLKMDCMVEIGKEITKFLENEHSWKRIKASLDGLYINSTILLKVRKILFKYGIEHFSNVRSSIRPQECDDETAYCYLLLNPSKQNRSSLQMAEEKIVDNLKPLYFNPYFAKKLADQVVELNKEKRIQKDNKRYRSNTYSDKATFKSNKLNRLSQKIYEEEESQDEKDKTLILDRKSLYETNITDKGQLEQDYNNIFQSITEDKDISRYSIHFEEEKEKKSINENLLVNKNSIVVSQYRTRKPSLFGKYRSICAEYKNVICMRSKHACNVCILEEDNEIDKIKEIFFKKSLETLLNFLNIKLIFNRQTFPELIENQKENEDSHCDNSISVKKKLNKYLTVKEIDEREQRKRNKQNVLDTSISKDFFENFENNIQTYENGCVNLQQPILPIKKPRHSKLT